MLWNLFSYIFFLEAWTALFFTFRSAIHLDLICVYGVRWGSNSSFPICLCHLVTTGIVFFKKCQCHRRQNVLPLGGARRGMASAMVWFQRRRGWSWEGFIKKPLPGFGVTLERPASHPWWLLNASSLTVGMCVMKDITETINEIGMWMVH